MSDNRSWVVCKFGGTSVSSRKTWDVIVKHTKNLTSQGYRVCIVVSAVSQVTNNLEKVVNGLAKETSTSRQDGTGENLTETAMKWIFERHQQHCEELTVDQSVPAPFLQELERLVEGIRLTGDAASSRLRSRVLGFGELMSSHIGEKVLCRELEGLHVGLVDARKILYSNSTRDIDGIGQKNSADRYLNADVTPFALDFDIAPPVNDLGEVSDIHSITSASGYDPRTAFFANKDVVITQGFIASTPEGQPCVLGRGGSDTSGALFSALLSAIRCEIWTDVDGMFSSDPRRVPNAHLIEELSYREAQELAAMGAKVLHPRCLGPASWGNIPVEIHNTMSESEKLTRILPPEQLQNGGESKVMAIARRTGQVLITIATMDMWGTSGFLSRVFAPFERLDISVDLLATSQYAVSMTLDYIPGGISGEPFKALLRALKRQGSVQVETDCTVVSIVGRKLRSVLHGMADAFRELERFNILLLSESTEDLNMSFVLRENELSVDELVLKLHQVLLEGKSVSGVHTSPSRDVQSPSLSAAISSTKVNEIPGSPVQRKVRAASFSSTSIVSPVQAVVSTSLSLAGLLNPENWLQEELEKFDKVQTPFAIIDLASLKSSASTLSAFSLAWSAQPAVLRTVYEANPNVVFICRSGSQVRELCSVVGPSPRVYVAATSSNPSALHTTIPGSVLLQSSAPFEEDVVKSNQVLGQSRVVVSSVVDEVDNDALVLDVWFSTKVSSRIHLLSSLPPNIRRVKALSPHDDIFETLFVTESDPVIEQNNQPSRVVSRVVITGVATTLFDPSSQKPINEYIRYVM